MRRATLFINALVCTLIYGILEEKQVLLVLFLTDYLKEWVRSSELAAIQPARFINDSGDTEEK